MISGAIKASYISPATTLADNGALFAVTVNDSNGSVMSNNAKLTVRPGAIFGSAKSDGRFGNFSYRQ